MKICKRFLAAIIALGLCVPGVLGASKGSSYEQKSSAYENKGSGGEVAGAEDVAVSGKIMFTDYYSMGGEKCAAFLIGEDGEIFCVLDNRTSAGLKEELKGESGKVKVAGKMTKGRKGRYLKVEEYNVLEEKPVRRATGYEKKSSGSKYKGSY